jgi:hypothetical protein
MFKGFRDLDGLEEPSDSDEKVNKLDPELISDLMELIVVESILSKKDHAKFKRWFATRFIFFALIVLALMFGIGSFVGNLASAEKWWGYVGPLVGFLINEIFSRHKKGEV